jgi:hypothetical protein
MARTICWDDYDDVSFVLDQHTELDFYSANHSPRVDMSFNSDNYYDSEPTSLCFYSLVLCA